MGILGLNREFRVGLREAVRLVLTFLPLFVLVTGLARAVVLYVSASQDPLIHVTTFMTNFGFLFAEDFVSFFIMLSWMFSLSILSIWFSDPVLRIVQSLTVFFFAIITLFGVQYYCKYDVPFDWTHARILSGFAELAESAGAEVDMYTLGSLVLSLAFALLWYFLLSSKLFRFNKSVTNMEYSRSPKLLVFRTGFAVSSLLCAGIFSQMYYNSSALFEKQRGKFFVEDPPLFALRHFESQFNQLYRLTFYQTPVVKVDNSTENIDQVYFTSDQFRFNTYSPQERPKGRSVSFQGKRKKYNVVLYLLEGVTKEYLELTVNGKPVTPRLAELTRNSFQAENYYANNPLSVDSLFTLLTSLYSLPSDRWAITDYPDLQIKTLPETLRENGYTTAYFHSGNLDYARQKKFLINRFDNVYDRVDVETKEYRKTINWGVDDRALIDPAITFMSEAQKTKTPFFTMLAPVSPHHPYQVPDRSFEIVDSQRKSSYKEKSFANYRNSLHYSDYVFGQFLDRMKKEGLLENTLVIVISDHGEAFGTHRGNYNHPFFLYQENIKVPLLIYNKDIFRGGLVFEKNSSHVDLAPTIFDMLDINAPEHYQGRSLFSKTGNEMLFFHTYWKNDYDSLLDGQYKYIYNYTRNSAELYNIAEDPGETNNLVYSDPGLSQIYRQILLGQRLYREGLYLTLTGEEILRKKNYIIEHEKESQKSAKAATEDKTPDEAATQSLIKVHSSK